MLGVSDGQFVSQGVGVGVGVNVGVEVPGSGVSVGVAVSVGVGVSGVEPAPMVHAAPPARPCSGLTRSAPEMVEIVAEITKK